MHIYNGDYGFLKKNLPYEYVFGINLEIVDSLKDTICNKENTLENFKVNKKRKKKKRIIRSNYNSLLFVQFSLNATGIQESVKKSGALCYQIHFGRELLDNFRWYLIEK